MNPRIAVDEKAIDAHHVATNKGDKLIAQMAMVYLASCPDDRLVEDDGDAAVAEAVDAAEQIIAEIAKRRRAPFEAAASTSEEQP